MPRTAKRNKEARKRVRLTPAARKQLILDAALIEFGAYGFHGASTAKIARRAGLSQAGLYAHFKCKEEILESLLQEVLSLKPIAATAEPSSGPAALDALIDRMYALVASPKVHALIRIMILEGSRMPHLIKRWEGNLLHPQLGAKQELIRRLVHEGAMQRSPMTETYRLFWSPVAHALILHMILGEEASKEAIATLREAHRCILVGGPREQHPNAEPGPKAGKPGKS